MSDFVAAASRKPLAEVVTLPLACMAGRAFLNLTCVYPAAKHTGYQVLQLAAQEADAKRLEGEELRQAAISATHEIVIRGYAEGIRVVIGRIVPELYDSIRDRPHSTEPWILIRDRNGTEAGNLTILWARLPFIPD